MSQVHLSYNVEMKTKVTINPLGIKLIGLVLFYVLEYLFLSQSVLVY